MRTVESRRDFLRTAGAVGASLLVPRMALAQGGALSQNQSDSANTQKSGQPNYTLHIRTSPIEIAPNRIISVTNYNGLFEFANLDIDVTCSQ